MKSGAVQDVSALQTEYEKASTALQAAQLDADTSRTVATMLEPQIEAAKAELTQAQAEHAATRIKVLREGQRIEIERCDKLREEINNSNIKAMVIQNRLAILLRGVNGYYGVERPITFDRETLLTKGALIARLEAEINAIGE